MKIVLQMPEYEPKRNTLLYHLKDHGYTWHSGKDLTTYRPGRFNVRDNALVLDIVKKTAVLFPEFSAYHEKNFKNDIVIEVL